MAIKSITIPIGAVGAGTNSGRVASGTPDDAVPREVVAVKSTLTTKGMTFTFDLNTSPQLVIDAAVLGQFTTGVPVDYAVPPNIQLSFSLANTTGGALVAGDFVTIFYKI